MTLIKPFIKRVFYIAQMHLGLYPKLFIPIYKAIGKKKHLLVGNSTDIVIEGFPRSGNTFAVVAFEWSQSRSLRIAHHLHAASQVIWGIEHDIPVVVLLREPKDAVISLVIREPYLTFELALRSYIGFYRAVLPCKSDCLMVKFEDITTDYGAVINQINRKYKTTFRLFDHSSKNVEKVFDLVQSYGIYDSPQNKLDETMVARPSATRKEMADKYRKDLDLKKYENLVAEAEKLYVCLMNNG